MKRVGDGWGYGGRCGVVCVVIKGLRHDDIQYTTLLLWVLYYYYYYGILYIYRSTCWALSLVCFVYVVLSLYYSRVVGMGVSSAVQLAVQQLQYVTPRTDRHAYGFSFHLTRAVPLQPRYWSFLRISSSPAWSQHAQSQLHPGSRIPVTLTAVSHL